MTSSVMSSQNSKQVWTSCPRWRVDFILFIEIIDILVLFVFHLINVVYN